MTQEHIHADQSTIETIGKIVVSASKPITTGGVTHLMVSNDYKQVNITDLIEKAQLHPNRKVGTTVLLSLDSFNEYVKEQGRDATTHIYADPDARTLTAVFNDHGKNADAGWRDQRAVYTAEYSREFKTWMENNCQPMTQEQFAIFLEDNIADVVEPSGDTLLKVALTLQAKTEVHFSSSKRLDNGQVQLTYTENTQATATGDAMEIPREFAIGCRLFKNGDGYKIKARLKYRLSAGSVKFWYELDRPLNAVEEDFASYVEKAKNEKFPLLIGKP